MWRWEFQDIFSLCRPLRGHARSHRDITGFETGEAPVGAGAPAKRPVQARKLWSRLCSPPHS
ncbi:hypothetical protein FYM84_26255 [Pseudomonas sp. CAH-1]|nr:hypothetical protein [Pseudomonas sp. CAH-1]